MMLHWPQQDCPRCAGRGTYIVEAFGLREPVPCDHWVHSSYGTTPAPRPTLADLAEMCNTATPPCAPDENLYETILATQPKPNSNEAKGLPKFAKPKGSSHALTKIERNDEIMRRLTTENVTMSDVAYDLGLTRERIRQIAKNYGHNARTLGIIDRMGALKREKEQQRQFAKEGRKHTKETLVYKMIELHNAGYTQREIGEVLGVWQNTVSRLLVEAGHRSRGDVRSGTTTNASPSRRPKLSISSNYEPWP